MNITEPSRSTPVCCEVDVAVVGGSCTGVIAAIRAARMGLRVAFIEIHNQFGGVATARLVNVWHSLWDLAGEKQIISGLTEPLMRRLETRNAVIERERTNPDWQFCFNPAELACELDEFVAEHDGIRPFLHARMVAAVKDSDGALTHLVIEDKSGRRAIACRFVIDASGDADVVRCLGMETRPTQDLQPPTMAAIIDGIQDVERKGHSDLRNIVFNPDHPKHLEKGFLWAANLPGSPHLKTLFGTRVHGVDCSDADQLTRAEMEGRAQLRRIVDMLRDAHGKEAISLAAIPACIGIRETRHVICAHQLSEREVLDGVRFPDAIANGTYRVDVHHQGGDGLTFRYLDGREVISHGDGSKTNGRWREATEDNPLFYQVPYRCLVPQGVPNLLVAGRHIDADKGAFGAIRVVVNCNQMGEAAGVAAALALRGGCSNATVDSNQLRATLAAEGAAMV
jgi:hypothetical protein